MRGDNLERHIKRHDRKTVQEDNVVNMGLYEGKMVNDDTIITNREQISYTSEKFIGLEKRVFSQINEFNRKIELGRNLKLIVDKHGLNENGLESDMKVALQTCVK